MLRTPHGTVAFALIPEKSFVTAHLLPAFDHCGPWQHLGAGSFLAGSLSPYRTSADISKNHGWATTIKLLNSLPGCRAL
jgi:hypothetical protein